MQTGWTCVAGSRPLWIVVGSAMCVFLASCGGGGGGGGTGGGSPFAGTYSANYTRSATGTVTIFVANDNAAAVVVTDSVDGVFSGTGAVGSNGTLAATAVNPDTQSSVALSAQFTTQGGTVNVSGSVAGAFTVAGWTGLRIAGPGVHAFAGSYSGTYWGSEGGTWTGNMASSGNVTANALSPSVGSVHLTGTVSRAGLGTLQGSGTGIGGPFTITWHGTWRVEGSSPVCSGNWHSTSGYVGEWSGQR